MREKSKDTVLTPKERHDTIIEKGGVKCMTKETERFTLRLTKELKWKLDESRKRMGISLNALVVQILWNWTECKDDEERKGESPNYSPESSRDTDNQYLHIFTKEGVLWQNRNIHVPLNLQKDGRKE